MSERRATALVTGGAKRVGRAVAEHLAASGFDVAITYLKSEREADDLRDAGMLAIRADFCDPPAAVEQIAAALDERFDRLDLLVNNASAYLPGTLTETTPLLMRQLMSIHVETPLLLCRRFEAPLRDSRGCVINMVDLLAERPWPKYLAYSASKAALANLTLGLARDLAPDVRVNAIAPGVVDWPPDHPEAEREKYLQRVPLRRAGTPQDVARLVHFLCTEGSYITGQILRLDGGRSIV